MNNKRSVFYAVLAAALFAVGTPLSKLLLTELPPAFMAALLYLGAGIGMSALSLIKKAGRVDNKEADLTNKDLPYVIGMILLDVAAPILLMFGLSMASPANVSLLNNFEIVATTLIALLLFKEPIGRQIWAAILLITLSCMLLSFEGASSLSFSFGSVLVLLAALCWGLENNCTRELSLKDPVKIVIVKGFGSGLTSLSIAAALGSLRFDWAVIAAALAVGFVSYGLSIYFYIKAQRELGAARTSAYYAVAPFIGAGLSVILFNQTMTLTFIIAALIMLAGTYLSVREDHAHEHIHLDTEHDHRHSHCDGHHNHIHCEKVSGEHSHVHCHEYLKHDHPHLPNQQHIHSHRKHGC